MDRNQTRTDLPGASPLRGTSWTAAGSVAPRRFRAGDDAQTLAALVRGRKRRRRCALPAHSMTRPELPGASPLRGTSWSAAVSRAERDQPQRVEPSSRVEYFERGHSCEAAAAGLRHSRGPGAGPATERGGKRSSDNAGRGGGHRLDQIGQKKIHFD